MLRKLCTPVAVLAAGLIAGTAIAGGENWTSDFSGAQVTAATEEKDLLLDFTGSDWCGWCVRLNEEVFSHDEFNEYADGNFVLVELDFPARTPISDELRAQNETLRERYNVRGFPTIILADADGLVYAQTGYQEGGPEAYVTHLEELKAVRDVRDEHFAAAEDAEGDAKAQHLHAAMQAMGDDVAMTHYEEIVQEIMELDGENEAGFRGHYQDLYTAIEQQEAMYAALREAGRDVDAAREAIETFLEQEGLMTSVRQEATAINGQILLRQENTEAAIELLEQAIQVDPESEMADSLRGLIERVQQAQAEAEAEGENAGE